jgi:hypothetical protein
MQEQPSGPDRGRLGNETEFVVLLLLPEPESPGPWSVAEIGREVGCELRAAEAVVRLDSAGLAHLSGELVFASRPAVRFVQLIRD